MPLVAAGLGGWRELCVLLNGIGHEAAEVLIPVWEAQPPPHIDEELLWVPVGRVEDGDRLDVEAILPTVLRDALEQHEVPAELEALL
ncbi:hypothetical protein V491_06637 [Pseudogymnoascus sp. VKM F-3775]|nr:hypothetical protein V491_06637 [Pseudogymnoascus sp. VKM F-3775]